MSDSPSGYPSQPSDGRSESPQHSNVHWEVRDVSVVGVLIVGISTCVFGALLLYFVHVMFREEARSLAEQKASRFPLAPHPSQQLPPEPRLEPIDQLEKIESSNVYERQLRKERELHRYGAASDEGFVRIPIERAIEYVAGTLPVRERPGQEDHASDGLLDAGEPNSGRLFGRKRH